MSYFAAINTATNICVNIIVADTQEIANNATPEYCTVVEITRTPTPIIGLMYDWNSHTFINPTEDLG